MSEHTFDGEIPEPFFTVDPAFADSDQVALLNLLEADIHDDPEAARELLAKAAAASDDGFSIYRFAMSSRGSLAINFDEETQRAFFANEALLALEVEALSKRRNGSTGQAREVAQAMRKERLSHYIGRVIA